MSGATPPIRAVLFDVDGTLYHQLPLRALMAQELLRLPVALGSLPAARRVWRAIAAFRSAREALRGVERPGPPLVRLQYEWAAERSGLEAEAVEAWIAEWFYARPLRHLRRCRRGGLAPALARLDAAGLRAGVLSDHPVDAKLEALGIGEAMSLKLCTMDPEIDAFKPHPVGFLRACSLWGLAPAEVLYVGDRIDVDAAGAAAAGLACAIVGKRVPLRRAAPSPARFLTLSTLAGLEHAIHRRH